MKVAFVDIYNPIPMNSGGDWYRYQILSELSQNNEVVEYYTFEKEKKGFFPNNVGFKTVFLPSKMSWQKVSVKLEMIRPELIFRRSMLKNIKADAVFTIAQLYHIGRYLSKINNAPLALVMHNVEWQYLKNCHSLLWVPMKLYENYALRRCDAVLSLSVKDKEYAARYTKKDKIFYIPPNIDTQIFNPNGPRYSYGNDKFNVLFYGSLDRQQNIEAIQFIKNELILELKRQNLMPKVRMNIFGSGCPPRHLNLKNEIYINFLGHVDDPSRYIRGADAVIVPLKNDSGVKIRIIESMACGKPIIVTPEAAAGLPSNIVKDVYVAQTVKEFAHIIGELMDGTARKSPSPQGTSQDVPVSTPEDVIRYLKELP